MSAFLTPLRFEDDGGFPFTLTDELRYRCDVERLRVVIVVKAGFKTDLASIPRALWNILPPVGKYDAAAVLHDCLYQLGGVPYLYGTITRAEADAVLLEAMGVLGVSRWQRWTIYAGVRAGGWKVWNKYRAAEQKAQAAA
jgi:Protein of unknown function (DUF1353)